MKDQCVCIIVGNIGKITPAVKADGEKIVTVAVGENFNLNGGVEWHRVVLKGSKAEFFERSFTKGDKVVCIDCTSRTRYWLDGKKTKHYVTEFITEDILAIPK